MKWYRPIPCDNTVMNPMVFEKSYIEDFGFTESSFLTGIPVRNWEKHVLYKTDRETKGQTPDTVLQNVNMLPIFSSKLVKTIQENRLIGFQFLPVTIENSDGTFIEDYQIANVINIVEAFNYEHSNYSYWPDDFPNESVRGKMRPARKYVLNKKALKNHNIIRLMEMNCAYFVSEKFKELFEANGFTGYSFVEIITV